MPCCCLLLSSQSTAYPSVSVRSPFRSCRSRTSARSSWRAACAGSRGSCGFGWSSCRGAQRGWGTTVRGRPCPPRGPTLTEVGLSRTHKRGLGLRRSHSNAQPCFIAKSVITDFVSQPQNIFFFILSHWNHPNSGLYRKWKFQQTQKRKKDILSYKLWVYEFMIMSYHITQPTSVTLTWRVNVRVFPSANRLDLLPYRGRGGRCGKHRVWLCGLWWTEHYARWCRPLLLQHGQSLAMTEAKKPTVTCLMSPGGQEEEEKTFQKTTTTSKRRKSENRERRYCTTEHIQKE